MSTARRRGLISIEDYLAGELASRIKHEYLGGFVYAMAGARVAHNIIAGNVFAGLHARLRGHRCRPFNSDMKIRVSLPAQTRFYYPDASVICKSNPQDASYQDEPVVVVEILSEDTRRIDEGEKKEAYLCIPSLSAYVLFEQSSCMAIVFRRSQQGFAREELVGQNAVLCLSELAIELPLSQVYEGVELPAEA